MGTSTKVPKVEITQSPTRCPFCHGDVRPASERWVACAGCLARHHDECWDEVGRCASCGIEGRLEPVFGPSATQVARRARAPLASGPDKAGAPGPTLRVSAHGGAPFARIGDALRNAPPGARILVAAGLYSEALVLDRPVAIVGEGPRAGVVLTCSSGDTVLMATELALIRGLTLRASAGVATASRSVVNVPGGELRVLDCDLSSELSSPIVGVRGAGARPLFKRCRIHSGRAGGVLVEERAAGTFEDCDLEGNRPWGLAVRGGARPLLRGCRIRGGGTGVFVLESGAPRLEGCDVASCDDFGVRVTTGGDPHLERCTIREAGEAGVSIEGGEGTFEDCRVTASGRAGLRIERGGSPRVRWCKVTDGRGVGIAVGASGLGVYEGTQVLGNALAGVEITGLAEPLVRRCRIRESGGAGVLVRTGGGGLVEDCELSANRGGSWDLEPRCRLRREKNRD